MEQIFKLATEEQPVEILQPTDYVQILKRFNQLEKIRIQDINDY